MERVLAKASKSVFGTGSEGQTRLVHYMWVGPRLDLAGCRKGLGISRRCTSQDPGGGPGEVYISSGVIASGTRGTRG